MHDRRNENDTVREARRAAEEEHPLSPHRRENEFQDGSDVTPRALAKREARERLADERAAEAGHLGAGIGDDRKGRAAPRKGRTE